MAAPHIHKPTDMRKPEAINTCRESENRIQSGAIAFLMGIMPAKEVAFGIGVTPAMISKVLSGDALLSAPKARSLSVLASVNGYDAMANASSAPWKVARPIPPGEYDGSPDDEARDIQRFSGLAVDADMAGDDWSESRYWQQVSASAYKASIEAQISAGLMVAPDPAQLQMSFAA